MSSLGEAFGDADDLLTLIALLPVAGVILVMVLNIKNPDFPMLEWFELGVNLWAGAVVPALGLIIFLGLAIWILGEVNKR